MGTIGWLSHPKTKKPLFPSLIKCAVEVDLWMEIKEMSHEKCFLIIILVFIYINHLEIICSCVQIMSCTLGLLIILTSELHMLLISTETG